MAEPRQRPQPSALRTPSAARRPSRNPTATRNPWTTGILVAAIAAIVVLGVQLRLNDPATTQAIVAEDPYTHMALVREHAADGEVEPLNTGESLYPPGLHAVVAGIWALTGLPLFDLVKFLPVAFGALGVIGIAILLWRWVGPVAATVGSLAYAVVPEVILRTTMLSPTALDLALLPFFLLALLEVLTGRIAWLAAAIPIGLLLVFAHPWVFTILAIAGILLLVLSAAVPWPAARGPLPTGLGLACAWAVLGVALSMSLWGCNGTCGVGFRDIVEDGEQLGALAPLVALLSLLPLTLVLIRRRALDWLVPRRVRDTPRKHDRIARRVAAAWLAVLLVAGTWPAFQMGLPPHVDLLSMVGAAVLVLAAIGIVLLPYISSPATQAAAAIGAATYPFVIYDPLHSPFWSHRTAVYFALACCILAGAAIDALARLLQEAWTIHVRRKQEAGIVATSRPPRPAVSRRDAFSLRRSAVLAAPALLVAIVAAGAVYAQAPEPYPWYRMYRDCEFDALSEIAKRAADDPDAVVIAGSWQAKLVLAALSTDAERIWYSDSILASEARRADVANGLAMEGRHAYIVVDPLLPGSWSASANSDLGSASWPEGGAWCGRGGEPTIRLYIHSGAQP